MVVITFLVDDDQWWDAGERRVGEFIEAQLQVDIHKTLVWYPVTAKDSPARRTVKIRDALCYFSGKLSDSRSGPIVSDKENRGRVFWEAMIDSDVPILGLGVFPENDPIYKPSAEFVEGIGLLWGSISFHVGEISKTITGKITEVKELPPAPMSTGLVGLRLLTLDTSSTGPLALKLLRPPR